MGNSSTLPSDAKKVIIVGGGYAGTTVAKGLDNHFQVTLVTPLDFLQHKYSFLRAAVVPGWEQVACVPLNNLLTNGKIIQAKVVSVSEGSVTLENGNVLQADYIILAHGGGATNLPSNVPKGIVDMNSFRRVLTEKQKQIQNSNNIVIVGGGPVGLELAGEIRAAHPNKSIKIIQGQSQILNNSTPPLVDKFINKVQDRLTELNIEVILNTKITNLPNIDNGDGFLVEPRRLSLSDGRSIESDLTIVCIGYSPSHSNILSSNYLDSSNRVKVDLTFKVEGLKTVYCIGDAANIPESKLGYLATQQANHLINNLTKSLQGKSPIQYTPASSSSEFGVMFLPLGPIKGVGAMGKTVVGNGITSKLKGKGLFKNKVFQSVNAVAPNL